MRELQEMLERAFKEGETIEDINEMVNAARQVAEEEKKNTTLTLFRSAAAIAIAQYLSELIGETVDEAEIDEHLLIMEKNAAAIMKQGVMPHTSQRPHIAVINSNETEDAFEKLIEKLGL